MAVRFSIVVPTYNRAGLITKAIDTVLSQTFSNWQLVIIDDGSTDNTKEVVAEYASKDERIKYIYQKNAERCAARNNGIKNSTGEYICFLDSDDYFFPNRLALLDAAISKMQNPVGMFYTGILFDNGKAFRSKTGSRNTCDNIFDFLLGASIGTPQACVHRTIFVHEMFNPKFHVGEDRELWIRIAQNFPIQFLENQLTVVATEHEDRTVGDANTSGYENHILTAKHIVKNFGHLFSSPTIGKRHLHDGYMGLARSYAHNHQNKEMLFAILNACSYSFLRSFKQKMFLIATNFTLFKPILLLYKMVKSL